MAIFSKLGRFYQLMLCRHPLMVQTLQTGLLMGTGDVIAQKVLEKKCKLDVKRTAQFFGLGMFLVGPALVTWYKFLSKKVTSCDKSAGFKKMALDQLLFAPVFLVVFIASLNAMKGKGLECIKTELRDKYKDILIANYKLWPAVQLVNFSIMPLAYQVLFAQIVALFWNVYLSWKTQQDVKEGKEDKEE